MICPSTQAAKVRPRGWVKSQNIRTKLSIPSLSSHLSEMGSTLVLKCCSQCSPLSRYAFVLGGGKSMAYCT